MLRTLIRLRGDPDLKSRSNISAPFLVRHPGHVQLLAERRADFGDALSGAVSRAPPETVRALLELRPGLGPGPASG